MSNATENKILSAIAKHSDPIVLMKDLRNSTKLSQETFNAAIISLASDRRIICYEHDFGGNPEHVKMRGSWFSSCSIPRR